MEAFSDSQTKQAAHLLKLLSKNYSEGELLSVLAKDTDIAKQVIVAWISGQRAPSSGTQKKVLACLKYWTNHPAAIPVRPRPKVPKKYSPPKTLTGTKSAQKLFVKNTLTEKQAAAILIAMKEKQAVRLTAERQILALTSRLKNRANPPIL